MSPLSAQGARRPSRIRSLDVSANTQVTGGGYIGPILMPALLEPDIPLRFLDDFITCAEQPGYRCANQRFSVVHGDVRVGNIVPLAWRSGHNHSTPCTSCTWFRAIGRQDMKVESQSRRFIVSLDIDVTTYKAAVDRVLMAARDREPFWLCPPVSRP